MGPPVGWVWSVSVLLLGELALQDLTRRVARKLLDEDDLARDLVARQVLLDVALQVLLTDFLALLLDNERHQPLPEVLVGEQVLDLPWEDVLPAGDDHLVIPAVDEQAALLVEVADVTRGEQLAKML